MNLKRINELAAEAFNVYIARNGLKFGSYANKVRWVGQQISQKSPVAKRIMRDIIIQLEAEKVAA